jgi:serine phosphatase RsbU (regulator of sigma subunit)
MGKSNRVYNMATIPVIYTDGVTESFQEDEEQFGEERLPETIRKHSDPRELIERVVQEVQKFNPTEQQDDTTLIAAKCRSC